MEYKILNFIVAIISFIVLVLCIKGLKSIAEIPKKNFKDIIYLICLILVGYNAIVTLLNTISY